MGHPAFAAGDIPVPPAFEGTDGLGHNPMHPLAMIGIVRNTLPPGHSTWFETAYGGPAPLGVTLNYNPPNVAPVGAIQMRKQIENEWTLILSGVVSVLFGILLFALPGPGLIGFVWVIAVYAILFGILLIGFAFRLKKHQHG